MARPLVAIVGRPNVGKSHLFNRLCGKRLSIVEDTPGVTRDRLYAECEWAGRTFDIVDTGGIALAGFFRVVLRAANPQSYRKFCLSECPLKSPSFGTFLDRQEKYIVVILFTKRYPFPIVQRKKTSPSFA